MGIAIRLISFLNQDPNWTLFVAIQERVVAVWKQSTDVGSRKALPVIWRKWYLLVKRQRNDQLSIANPPDAVQRRLEVLNFQVLKDLHTSNDVEGVIWKIEIGDIHHADIGPRGFHGEVWLYRDVDADHLIVLSAQQQCIDKLARKDTDVENVSAVFEEFGHEVKAVPIGVPVESTADFSSVDFLVVAPGLQDGLILRDFGQADGQRVDPFQPSCLQVLKSSGDMHVLR
jgi:hypothetical protein